MSFKLMQMRTHLLSVGDIVRGIKFNRKSGLYILVKLKICPTDATYTTVTVVIRQGGSAGADIFLSLHNTIKNLQKVFFFKSPVC